MLTLNYDFLLFWIQSYMFSFGVYEITVSEKLQNLNCSVIGFNSEPQLKTFTREYLCTAATLFFTTSLH